MFEELGKGYEGATIEKEGRKYKFVDYRSNTIHGLFGEIGYQRAYYVSSEEGVEIAPFLHDRTLTIHKRRGAE